MEPRHHGTARGPGGLAPPQHQVVSRGLQRRLLDERERRRKLLLVPSPSSPAAPSPSSPSSRGGAPPSELRRILFEHGLPGTAADDGVPSDRCKLAAGLLR